VFDPIVRPATAADHEALEQLEREAREGLVEARGGERWLAQHPAVGPGWADLVARPDVAVYVGVLDDVVVGLLVAAFEPDDTIRVAGAYVHPQARECGFGDALMEATVAAGRAHRCLRIEGEALPGDRDTKNLYERAGITARLIVVSKAL
jgi:GNAT superfamily N-acetyltransferase